MDDQKVAWIATNSAYSPQMVATVMEVEAYLTVWAQLYGKRRALILSSEARRLARETGLTISEAYRQVNEKAHTE